MNKPVHIRAHLSTGSFKPHIFTYTFHPLNRSEHGYHFRNSDISIVDKTNTYIYSSYTSSSYMHIRASQPPTNNRLVSAATQLRRLDIFIYCGILNQIAVVSSDLAINRVAMPISTRTV
jgi:hypothetical protein